MPMVRQHFEGKLLNKHVNMLKHFDQISKVYCEIFVQLLLFEIRLMLNGGGLYLYQIVMSKQTSQVKVHLSIYSFYCLQMELKCVITVITTDEQLQ